MPPTNENVEATATTAVAPVEGLFGSPITVEHLEKELQDALHTKAKFGPNFSVEQIGLGQGFLSIMFRAKFDWQGDDAAELPKSLVCKIPSILTMVQIGQTSGMEEKWDNIRKEEGNVGYDKEKGMQLLETMIKTAHSSESALYSLINKDKLELCVPKCYLAKDFGENGECGIIVLEDLCDTAATKPIYEGLPVESLKTLMENLAIVHAYSLTHKEWLDNPALKMSFRKMQEMGGDQLDTMVRTSLTILKKDHPTYFDPLINRLSDSVNDKVDLSFIDSLHEEFGIPPVLTHGDLWMNNMMWKKCEDGKGTTNELAAIVDWQIVHPGCIGEDFVRLFCSSVSPEVRRENLDEIIEHYHSALKAKLGKEPPFTMENIKDAYKRMFRLGVLMIVPAFGAFVMAGFNMLGAEDQEKRKHDILTRCKCLVEDLYAYEDGTE